MKIGASVNNLETSPIIEKTPEINVSSFIGRPCPNCDELYRVNDLKAHILKCRASEPTSTTQDATKSGENFCNPGQFHRHKIFRGRGKTNLRFPGGGAQWGSSDNFVQLTF